MPTPPPELSVIVPFFNEEGSIGPLYAAIVAAVEPLGVAFEMLFVDDGSTDRTLELATQLARQDPRVRVVRFRRNYGQTPAMAAGIEYARGATLLTMDGDLQNDPADIRLFLDKIASGYDIVVGWREKRQDHLLRRKIPSRIANWLIGKVTGVPIRDNGCSLKAYRATVMKSIPLYSEMHRFIPAMAMTTAATEPRFRGRVMAFNSAVQNLGSGSAAFVAGLILNTTADGKLEHFPSVGVLACVVGLLAMWAGSKVRKIS